jgi:hypothetical protein
MPAFWGVAPRNMKTGTEDSKAYFRIKPSCHASGVTPPNMKIGSEDSKAYFRINLSFPRGTDEE